MILEKGQIVKVVQDCTDYAGCFELVDGPKQGDTVWIKGNESDKWIAGVFIGSHTYQGTIKYIVVYDGCLGWFDFMTTTDPYALKYDLTPLGALVAIVNKRRVQRDGWRKGVWLEWCDELGIVMVVDGVKSKGTLGMGVMYAIAGE